MHGAEPPPLPEPGALRRLEPAVRTVWTIRNAIGATIVVLVSVTYDATGWLAGAERALPHGTITLLVVLLGLAYAVVLPRLQYRFWRFALRDEELLAEYGVWTRVRTVVPLRRVQHIDVAQDVIERGYDLGRLIVHTAGTRANTVVVPGLDIHEAERLREEIKHYVMEDAL